MHATMSNSIVDSNYAASTTASSIGYGVSLMNSTEVLELDELEYIFDRRYVRVIFIVLYTIVFCFCFFGNLMVILVVTLHWKMSQTKICLANLAFADLTVGVFCVYQNLSVYLINSWMFGQFLCKMYHFVNSLSHTASILILVVICVERYLAIIHPFKCKQLLTIKRLWLLIVGVWFASAVYSSPKLYYIVTLKVLRMEGESEIICTAKRTLYDSRTFDICHFFLLFLLPLITMTIMYFRVGVVLWTTSKGCLTGTPVSFGNGTSPSAPTTPHQPQSVRMRIFRNPTKGIGEDLASYLQDDYDFRMNSRRKNTKNCRPNSSKKFCNGKKSQYVVETHELKIIGVVNVNETGGSGGKGMSGRDFTSTTSGNVCTLNNHHNCIFHPYQCCSSPNCRCGTIVEPLNLCRQSVRGDASRDDPIMVRASSKCSQAINIRGGRDALRIRRAVIKMLIVIVLTFAICNFPFHLRKMFLYFSPHFQHHSISSTLATPITSLIMFANAGVNPIIYVFLSKSFRTSFAALLKCKNSLELPNNEIASTSEVLNLKYVAGEPETDKMRRQIAKKNSCRRNRIEYVNEK